MYNKFSNAPEYVFNNPKYISYVVEYQGNIEKDAALSSEFFITVINEKYAVITFPFQDPVTYRYTLENNPFPSVVYISRYYIYTLESREQQYNLSPIVTSNIYYIHNLEPLKLKGKGVVVGIIDTGIDYLNSELLNEDGSTRILNIWDQTFVNNNDNKDVPFGTVYTEEEINKAISASKNGKSPYDIVPSMDDIGHGTSMAGVIGAKGYSDKEIMGAAPDCNFVAVKLSRDEGIEELLESKDPLYGRANIMLALQYVFDYAVKNNVPMVIYLPLGTTLGNHRKNGVLEDFIDDICNNIGIAVVTGTGNQADANNHISGYLREVKESRDIELYMSKEQKYLRLELWTDNPNIISIEIISPSGETTGILPALLKSKQNNKFIIEESEISIEYFLPDDLTGDELVYVGFGSLQPGIWTIRLYGDYVVTGRYDLWMLQKALLYEGTRFNSPDNYGTITNPSSGRYSITVANYNQNNFNVVSSSGVYFREYVYNPIDVAAGGVNVKTIAPNNKIVTVSGTSVSAAVTAGAAALLFQWGLVEKNDVDMYSQTLKSYLLRGTAKKPNDKYPNPKWGYGILDLLGVFRNLE